MASVQLESGSLLNDRYHIQSVIGQGGMGTVYLAQQQFTEQVVAVKEMRSQSDNEEQQEAALKQCVAEARMLAKLHHPHLPQVMDAFIQNDRCYLVMEFINGVTLERRLRENAGSPLDALQVVDWGLQITDVLAYLHALDPPIIFRDLKPANIMIEPGGNVRLIDFGIARRFQPGASKDTVMFGSVGYSPPEQFGLSQTDARADIYALGATLHHLLTGRDPAPEPFKFPPVASLNPAVPTSLSQLVAACVAMEAEKRPAAMQEVANRLHLIREELVRMPRQAVLLPPGSSVQTAIPNPSSGSGKPRIISAKLNAAEAKQRRDTRRSSAKLGTATGTPVSGSRSGLLALIVGLLLVGGTGLAIVLSKKPARQTVTLPPIVRTPFPNMPAPANNTQTQPDTQTQNTTQEITAPLSNAVPPASQDSVLTFDTTIGRRLVNGPDGQMLEMHLTGHVDGEASQAGKIAVFFYDGDQKPLLTRDPHSVYANPQGQLSVAKSLQVHTNSETFDLILTVPVSQFPDPVPSVVKFRCMGYINQQQSGATEMTDLNPAPDTGSSQTTPTTNGAVPPGNG